MFDFVDTLEEVDGMEYSLVSNYPRRVFQRAADGGVTLLDGGLHPARDAHVPERRLTARRPTTDDDSIREGARRL